MDEEKMRENVKSAKIQKIIGIDTKDRKQIGIRGTPYFFINGEPLKQFGAEQLKRAIDQAFN